MEIPLNLFFINEISFLQKKWSKIDFRSVQSLNTRETYEIISDLNKVNNKYKERSYTVTEYYGNNSFEPLWNILTPAHLHICTVNEHIGYIEQSVWTIKDSLIFGCHSMPYKNHKVNYKIACPINGNLPEHVIELVPRLAAAVTWLMARACGTGSPTDRPKMLLAL